ncbi:hypothetical protein RhoFasK5_00167|nr:hypothetical protein [Rhodococcus kroppenstedtii]
MDSERTGLSGLDPMRPVSVAPEEWPSTPAWKSALSAVVPVAIVGLAWLGPPVVGLVLGVGALVVGPVLSIVGARRVLRENAGRRVPWWGEPPIRRRDRDLVQSAAGSCAAVAAVGLVRATGSWWFLLAAVAVFVPDVVLHARHNRAVRRENRVQ